MPDRYATKGAGGLHLLRPSSNMTDHVTEAVAAARRDRHAWMRCTTAPGAVLHFHRARPEIAFDHVQVDVIDEAGKPFRLAHLPGWVIAACRLLDRHFSNITHAIEETPTHDEPSR